jgi:hypothetical protein
MIIGLHKLDKCLNLVLKCPGHMKCCLLLLLLWGDTVVYLSDLFPLLPRVNFSDNKFEVVDVRIGSFLPVWLK